MGKDLAKCGWDLSCSPWFDSSILQDSGIWGATDESVLNVEQKKKTLKKFPFYYSHWPLVVTDHKIPLLPPLSLRQQKSLNLFLTVYKVNVSWGETGVQTYSK